jgi:DNA-binding response OmpR family regulator
MTSRRILIVDDDADLSDALIDQLSLYEEFELSKAGTAAAGIQQARDSHVDLIIMDVGLPDMEGGRRSRSCARRRSGRR